MRTAAADASASFWEALAACELHWFHQRRGAWLSRRADSSVWEGWATADASAATLDGWQPWEAALDASEAPLVRWFCGGQTNAAFNELDRHVLAGHGDETAFVSEPGGAEQLAEVVLEHASLTDFCSIPLVSLRENSLTELNLKNKLIGLVGAIVLIKLLPTATVLASLKCV